MPFDFPDHNDLPLKNPPLSEVVWQVRFPRILKIDAEPPSAFQERVRRRFPGYQVEHGVVLWMPAQPAGGGATPEAQPPIHHFLTADMGMRASLTANAITLTARRYPGWRDFVEDVELLTQALGDVYQPAYVERLGLRFVNVFTTGNTRQPDFDSVLGLLRPEFTSLLHVQGWREAVNFVNQWVVAKGDALLAIRSALGREGDQPFFMLDIDHFFEGQLELTRSGERLEQFHRTIYNVFRWSLAAQALAVFEPAAT